MTGLINLYAYNSQIASPQTPAPLTQPLYPDQLGTGATPPVRANLPETRDETPASGLAPRQSSRGGASMPLYAELEVRQRQNSAWDLPPSPNLPSHAHIASNPQPVSGVPQSPSRDVVEGDGTTNLAPPQFDDGTLYIEGTDTDGAERNPYTTHYDTFAALCPTLRDMAATNVYSLTVASMRKAARMLGVKHCLPRA
jgi:hypothetical protein